MAAITVRDLVKRYGAERQAAVDHVDLEIADGELVILVGPSGCGKSTLLRMIAGLEPVTSGEVLIDGEVVNDRPPRERNLAMVFQNYALYPHLDVFENIAFPLRLRKLPDDEVRPKVEEVAAILELGDLLSRKPAQLSGGQRQRVAMGRAIVREAAAYLFDEPLSNLDARLRGEMRTEIARLQHRLGTTMVYVTHDQVEAMTLGDRLAVLRKGRLQQVGTPRQLYESPVNLFVAGFIGSPPMNFLPAVIDGGTVRLPFAEVDMPAPVEEGLLIAGIRPESFQDAHRVGPAAGGCRFQAEVDVVEWLGREQYAYVPFEAPPEIAQKLKELAGELDSDSLRTQLVVELDAASKVRPGEPADLWFEPERLMFFDPATGERLADL